MKLGLGFRILDDPLSIILMMMLIVTGVGGAIHIYSSGYMHDDPGYSRYFACLSLFTFSMLGIVLANNFIMMFIAWELVGVSSYLLIGFLVRKTQRRRCRQKGVYHEPARRFRISARHFDDLELGGQFSSI